MIMAKTPQEAINIVKGESIYLEDERFYWVEKEKRLVRVLKPRDINSIQKILKDGEFPTKYIKAVLSKEKQKTKALELIKKEKDAQGIILSGKAGIGKTFATIYKIAQLVYTHKINNPLYITFQDFDVKKEQDNKRLSKYDCFLIDDLNPNINSWEKKFATEIIYHAYNNEKLIFITTNSGIKDFFNFIEEEPVISRLLETCKTLEVNETKDLRLQRR